MCMLMPQSDRIDSPAGLSGFKAKHYLFADATRKQLELQVAVEVPVSFGYGGMPYAVMMVTPDDLRDFAYGFSLTEGVIQSVKDIRSVEIRRAEESITVEITLSSDQFKSHLAKRRMMSGRTACGLCGIERLDDLPVADHVTKQASVIQPDAINRALQSLEGVQSLNRLTRSVHAAAWCNDKGEIIVLREDVGRHNALDKTIGHLLQKDIKAQAGFFVITSRASFEMVEKAALFGAQTIVAVSAPTSLAIRRADALGVRLIAIARQDSMIEFTTGFRQAGENSNHE